MVSHQPNEIQTLLLRAALADGLVATAAYDAWRARVDLDHLDPASTRLIPLLAHNLRRGGLAVNLGRYDGLLKGTWVLYHKRVTRLLPVIEALRAAGIPVMLMKGMAIAAAYSAHPGLRPMDDADLLVPVSQAAQAGAVLESAGWHTMDPSPMQMATKHARPYVATSQAQIDLHWAPLVELVGQPDDDLWARAEMGNLGGVPVRVMPAEDLLLQVVVHGARWSAVPPIRWIADAVTILQARRETFDWDRLLALASRHALMLPLRDGLGLLAGTFDTPLPPYVSRALQRHRPSWFERVEQRTRAWTSPQVGGFPFLVCHHLRLTRGDGAVSRIAGLPRYLADVYGLPSTRRLPGVLWQRARRRLSPDAPRRSS